MGQAHIIYREQLDQRGHQGCANPDCHDPHHMDPMFLHSRCHPSRGVWASYSARSGVLSLICTACDALVARIQIAHDPEPAQLPGTGDV